MHASVVRVQIIYSKRHPMMRIFCTAHNYIINYDYDFSGAPYQKAQLYIPDNIDNPRIENTYMDRSLRPLHSAGTKFLSTSGNR